MIDSKKQMMANPDFDGSPTHTSILKTPIQALAPRLGVVTNDFQLERASQNSHYKKKRRKRNVNKLV